MVLSSLFVLVEFGSVLLDIFSLAKFSHAYGIWTMILSGNFLSLPKLWHNGEYCCLKEGACGDELSAWSRAVLPTGADSALPGLGGAGSAQVPGRQEGDVGEAGRLL